MSQSSPISRQGMSVERYVHTLREKVSAAFEKYLEGIPFLSSRTELALIDEIGKMECLSEKFTRLMVHLLDAPIMVVATIALHGGGIIDSIENRADVRLYRLTRENRDSLVEEIERDVREGLARPGSWGKNLSRRGTEVGTEW